MSVITVKKPFDEVLAKIKKNGDLRTLVIGCDKCARISQTGGTDEVKKMKNLLSQNGVALYEKKGLKEALEEGLCDPEAVSVYLRAIDRRDLSGIQLLILSCGAGLKCVKDNFPQTKIIPGLNTLGPGVKGELACLSCGDCSFDDEGCRMTKITKIQFEALSKSYRSKEE